MATKRGKIDTNQYSGVSKAVKTAQKPKAPQEPLIKPEHVVSAFHSFGYKPNQEKHNDIAHWATQPESNIPKMVSELHAKRTEENQKFKDQSEKREAARPMTDQEINQIFDEYGMPSPDTSWVRKHLPNDEEKLRQILDIQHDSRVKQMKVHAGNHVQMLKEAGKAQSQPMLPMLPMQTPRSTGTIPMDGSGGPGADTEQMGDMNEMSMPLDPQSVVGVKPHFVGDHALVRIQSPGISHSANPVWLVDTKKKVLRPFHSGKAFHLMFKNNHQEAVNAIVNLPSSALGPDGVLDGFKMLTNEHGIRHDGSMKNIEFSPADFQKKYGAQGDDEKELHASSVLDGLFNQIKKKK